MTKAQVSQHKNNPIKSLLTVISQRRSRVTRLLTVTSQPINQKLSLLSKPINRRSKWMNNGLTPVKR